MHPTASSVLATRTRHITRTVVKDILVYITLRRINASVCDGARGSQSKQKRFFDLPSILSQRLETPRAPPPFLFLFLGGVFVFVFIWFVNRGIG